MSNAMIEVAVGSDGKKHLSPVEVYDARVHLATSLINSALRAGASETTINVGAYFKIAEEIDAGARDRGWIAES